MSTSPTFKAATCRSSTSTDRLDFLSGDEIVLLQVDATLLRSPSTGSESDAYVRGRNERTGEQGLVYLGDLTIDDDPIQKS